MNRSQRRVRDKTATKQGKQKFTLVELQKAFSIGLEMKKESRGHLFNPNIKNQETDLPVCTFCGLDQSTTEGECEYWLLTFLDRVQTILLNPLFFIGDDSQANYFQHGDEYAEIRLPKEAQ
jgi:hypothetical protein